jgi:long-chain fatty acid transport protein
LQIRHGLSAGLAACAFALTPCVHAAHGVFMHGFGASSSGAGGVAYATAEDSYPIAANPALLSTLGERWDVGLETLDVRPAGSFEGNALGPDREYESRKRFFFIPQFGFVSRIGDRWSAGMSAYAAGFGTDYDENPYARFGASPRGGADLSQIGLCNAIAFSPWKDQSFGIGLNTVYEVLDVKGLDVFTDFSESPGHFTNQGKEGAFGVGAVVGWHGRVLPWLKAGLSYRSKTWTQRFKEYDGLLPDHGRLELPAIYGGGIAITPAKDWTIALDVQRYLYESESALGNRISELTQEGHLFGSKDGPGFGWRNQNVYKLGVIWHTTDTLTLRAGYSYDAQLMRQTETLLAFIAPNPVKHHYTLGASYALTSNWDLTGYAYMTNTGRMAGEGSIPPPLGGGEADSSQQFYGYGFSVGRRFH